MMLDESEIYERRMVEEAKRQRLEGGEIEFGGEAEKRAARSKTAVAEKRIWDPKTFGAIPGIEVGRAFATRMEASLASIHA